MAGFTNNPSVVLLVVADMSVIEAEIEVDETDIPNVQLGQKVQGHRSTRCRTGRSRRRSPRSATARSAPGRRARPGVTATNFKVVVTLDDEIPEVRPGFTCTADITTATRKNATAVPIQAMTIREVVLDAKGTIVRQPKKDDKGRRPSRSARWRRPS